MSVPTTPETVVTTTAPNSQWPIMIAVIVAILAAMGAVIAVVLRGGDQSTPLLVTILGFTSTLIGTLLALVKVQQVGNQTAALRVEVNHRLTELVTARSAASLAEGKEMGGDKARSEATDAAANLALLQGQMQVQAAELAALRATAAPPVAAEPVAVIVANAEPVKVTVHQGE